MKVSVLGVCIVLIKCLGVNRQPPEYCLACCQVFGQAWAKWIVAHSADEPLPVYTKEISMKTLFVGVGVLFLGIGSAFGQALPEPLSFTGVPTTDSTALVDLSARFGFFDNGNVDTNFSTFIFEGRFQVNQQFSLYGTLPINDFAQDVNVLGVIIETDDTAVANPEIGGLFSLAAGPTTAAFGLGLGIPVLDGGDISAVSGFVTNDINAVLYAPDTLALRPHFRLGAGAGVLSVQALLGLDLGFGVDNNNDEIIALRGGVNAGIAVAPSFSLMGEVTFASNLDDDNDFDFATLHLGGRGMLQSGPSVFQPAFEFFLPIADDFDNIVEFGFALSLRAVL
jgi:hypothetical protein